MSDNKQAAWDLFAAAVMAGRLACESETWHSDPEKPEKEAEIVSRYADALLAERKKRVRNETPASGDRGNAG